MQDYVWTEQVGEAGTIVYSMTIGGVLLRYWKHSRTDPDPVGRVIIDGIVAAIKFTKGIL